MTVIKIRERSRTTFVLEGMVAKDLIKKVFEDAKCSVSDKKEEDIYMSYDYSEIENITTIKIYPCAVEFKVAYPPKNLGDKSDDAERSFVGACNIHYDARLFQIKDEDVVNCVWMPIKKSCKKSITMIPYFDHEDENCKYWHLLCDCRLSATRSRELMLYAATHMMDAIALNVDGIDVAKNNLPVLLYLDQVSENFRNLLLEQNLAD